MSPKKVWITPSEAASEMSNRAGYKISPDDIKQLRHEGKIKRTKRLNNRITLYHIDEIQIVKPPKKRNPQPIPDQSEKGVKTGPITP